MKRLFFWKNYSVPFWQIVFFLDEYRFCRSKACIQTNITRILFTMVGGSDIYEFLFFNTQHWCSASSNYLWGTQACQGSLLLSCLSCSQSSQLMRTTSQSPCWWEELWGTTSTMNQEPSSLCFVISSLFVWFFLSFSAEDENGFQLFFFVSYLMHIWIF